MSKSFGRRLEQQVANAAADQIRDVVVLVEPVQNFERVGIDVAARNRVLRPRNDGRAPPSNGNYSIIDTSGGD